MTNADATFKIGSTHHVCQDYAVVKNTDNTFALVLDGCSSSPHTDTGVRFLAHHAMRDIEIKAIAPTTPELAEYFCHSAVRFSMSHASMMNLPPECLDATMLGIFAPEQDENAYAFIYGDGVLVLKRKETGNLLMSVVDFARNYPVYPSYESMPERKRRVDALVGNTRNVNEWIFTEDNYLSERRSPHQGYAGTERISFWTINKQEYSWAGIFTDGLLSFRKPVKNGTSKVLEPISFWSFIKEMTNFKNTNGVFVERRINRFLKDKAAEDWQHADDFGVAVVSF